MSVLFTRRGVAPVFSKLASDYAVGESVFLTVNGTPTEFLVVHQGNPDSTLYDASCDGTWLLMKDLYGYQTWGGNSNEYAKSNVHTYLNGTFLNLLDANVQSAVQQVKLPYKDGAGSTGSVVSGSDGLSAKIFLLSAYELGWTASNSSDFPVDGTKLDYFITGTTTAANALRIARYDSTPVYWWVRSPRTANTYGVWIVFSDGTYYDAAFGDSWAVRPALILPSDTEFDPDTNNIL